jgi:hypothetical protein
MGKTIQTQLEAFHEAIRLDEDDEKSKLREKRDILIAELKRRLPDNLKGFTSFNQGSYAMHTGTRPLDGNYDIDVGLIFNGTADECRDPVELKRLIEEAITYSNRTVDVRKPCVTVTYIKDGQADYHIDLAIYKTDDVGQLWLARGKSSSPVDERFFELSEPKELTNLICSLYSDPKDREQYRRCIRYLKRWRDLNCPNCQPVSIALTIAAYYWFRPCEDVWSRKPDDLKALKDLVGAIADNFVMSYGKDIIDKKLTVKLPTLPQNDLMASFSKKKMNVFENKLNNFYDRLEEATCPDVLPEEACGILQKQLGSEFPLISADESAERVNKPYISTGSSA